jgi:hypothetical protein
MNTEPQTTHRVLLIAPARFAANPQTAHSNEFQTADGTEVDSAAARSQCLAAARALRSAGIDALLFDDTEKPAKPDAVFPNNWFSTHAEGRVVLYPLAAPNRRPERRVELLARVAAARGLRINETLSLVDLEAQSRFLEGTGSLVLDRPGRVAYAAWSERTHRSAAVMFAKQLGYRLVGFETRGPRGKPVYHTNVLLALGKQVAVVCADAILPADRSSVLDSLRASGREILTIQFAQMASFAGNMLELASSGGPVIALSAAALESLDERQRQTLSAHARLLPLRVDEVERGGGSVRCMLGEIFLPRHR